MGHENMSAIIPFDLAGNVGAAYNRAMAAAPRDGWVTFLDHDALLLNPYWARMLAEVQAECVARRIGLLTCWTNNIGRTEQRDDAAPPGRDLDAHRARALELWERWGCRVSEISSRASGVMLTVYRPAWEAAGRFSERGLFRVDWLFSDAVRRAGWKIGRLDGLYAFHLRDREAGAWVGLPGWKTSADIRAEQKPK